MRHLCPLFGRFPTPSHPEQRKETPDSGPEVDKETIAPINTSCVVDLAVMWWSMWGLWLSGYIVLFTLNVLRNSHINIILFGLRFEVVAD